jgi:hypothetical protein
MITTNDLQNIGFDFIFTPAKKGIDYDSLRWGILFEAGQLIDIKLAKIENTSQWILYDIRIHGDKAFNIVRTKLINWDIQSVYEFVKNIYKYFEEID